MKLSVLIVTHQSERHIVPCIESVLISDPRAEIIVVDNASSDRTVAMLKAHAQARVLVNTENVGFSKAVNQAASYASGEALLLLNPDTLLCVSSIPRLVAALVRNPQLDAVGPISNNAAALQSAKHWIPNAKELSTPEMREQAAMFLIHKFGGRVHESKLLTGFCLLIRKACFHELEGLDEKLILGFDDLDLCWRMTNASRKCAVTLDSYIFHAWHKSFEAGRPEMVEAMHQKSFQYFSQKLAAHYGGMDRIPPSMELWGVDWFTPQPTMAQSAPSLLLETRICIWAGEATASQNDAVAFTLGSYLQAGIPASHVLLINAENEMVDCLRFRAEVPWSAILAKVESWFGVCRLLWVEAGLFVEPSILHNEKCGTGPLSGVSKRPGPESQGLVEWDLEQAAQGIPGRWLFYSTPTENMHVLRIPWKDSMVAQSMSWAPALARASAKVLEQPFPELGSQNMELPLQLSNYLQGLEFVGIMGKGQLLDLQNTRTRIADCNGLVWRLHPLELPGMSFLLREIRISGLKRLLVLFDNAFYQAPGGWNSFRGVSPFDVRREVQQAGFRIAKMEHWQESPEVPYSEHYSNVHIRSEYLPDEILMATASRLLLVCEPCKERTYTGKKVSVVLLALNQLEYTRKCLESIKTHCRQSLELILVNNGSTDGTLEYFQSIPGAIVIHNEKNLGVAAGWNQGMARASGEYILILNNDTIVGPNCIENMVRCAENHPEAGMVVPRSNKIAGPQMVEGFHYNSESEIPALAAKIQQQNELSCWEFPRLKGFCMLVPRHVVRQVGNFDERFGYGNFEDDDYSCRVRYSGYTLLVADDSFLFHFGSVSFKDSGIDWNKQMIDNMDKFNRKWAHGRKEAMKLAPAPESPILAQVPGDWVQQARQMREAGRAKDAFGMYCRALEIEPTREDLAAEILDLLGDAFEADTVTEVLEFLRRRYPHLRSLHSADPVSRSLETEWVQRVQALIESGQYERALAILLDVHIRQGDDFEVCNLLGVAKFQLGHIDEASRWFEKALKLNPTNGDALLNYYDCVLRLGIPQQAIKYFEQALRLDPNLHEVQLALQEIRATGNHGMGDPMLVIQARELNINAENLIREGMPERAREVLQDILQKQPTNYRAMNNLGLLSWYSQEMVAAWDLFLGAFQSNPWYLDAVVNLYDCAFLSHRLEEFMPVLAKATAVNPGAEELAQIESEIREGRAPVRLQVYFRKDAEQTRLREQIDLGHRMLDEQKIDSAVMIFTDLLNDYPDQVECLNGVGIVAFYRGEFDDAYDIFRHAIKVSPLDSDSLVNLWDAAQKCGKTMEAKSILQNAISVDPSLKAVAEILEEC